MPKILITGFTPFPGAPENPTADLVEMVKRGEIKEPSGCQLRGLLLPTEYQTSVTHLEEELQTIEPHILLEFGLSAKAAGFTLERTARNEITALQPDNKGEGSTSGLIAEGGPATLPTGLPVESLLEALTAANLPASYSDDAGGYVCNHLFYRTMTSTLPQRPAKAGFIHIPYLKDQRDRLAAKGEIKQGLAAMTREDLMQGVEVILKAVAI